MVKIPCENSVPKSQQHSLGNCRNKHWIKKLPRKQLPNSIRKLRCQQDIKESSKQQISWCEIKNLRINQHFLLAFPCFCAWIFHHLFPKSHESDTCHSIEFQEQRKAENLCSKLLTLVLRHLYFVMTESSLWNYSRQGIATQWRFCQVLSCRTGVISLQTHTHTNFSSLHI